MDETTREIIRGITVRYPEPRKLPGRHSGCVYYDCPRLSPSQLSRLAASALWEDEHIEFDIVVGLAYRGIFFAFALAGGKEAAILQADGGVFGPQLKGQRVIVVDDVIVGGSTMKNSRAQLEAMGAIVVGFACIVDRSNGAASKELGLPLISSFRTSLE